MKTVVWAAGAVAATLDIARRRIVCLRRGYHRTLDPGDSCIDCWIYVGQR